MDPAAGVDVTTLHAALDEAVDGEVRFDAGTLSVYAQDASNYRQVPIGVVVPRTVDAAVAAIAVCREAGAPVLSRGGGTSLAGQCVNTAVVIDWTKYCHYLVSFDKAAKTAIVQPGAALDKVNDALAPHGLMVGPKPSTHVSCTIGGMIGNNSCGSTAQAYGKTADSVRRLEVLCYGGLRTWAGETNDEEFALILAAGGDKAELYRRLRELRDAYLGQIRTGYPKIPRRVSGYNLDQLLPENGFHVARALVGSESTLVTVLHAEIGLFEVPRHRSLVVLGYPDITEAADVVPRVVRHDPLAVEGLDDTLISLEREEHLAGGALDKLPEGSGWLMIQFGGDTKDEAERKAHALIEDVQSDGDHPKPHVAYVDDPAVEDKLQDVREAGLGATAYPPGKHETHEGWEDAAVPPERLGDYLRDFRKQLERYDYQGASLYGHFGQGCVHTRVPFELRTDEGIAKYRSFVEEAADLVVSYGGSLSGEHGDGQSRGELLPKMFGPELVQAFREFKSAWDPDWKMNPGKLIEPYKLDENLRLGAAYSPWEPETNFKFLAEHGSLAQATLRCVGVGKCRRDEGGVMCPSYRVTRDEEHSTRGRAHLLWEMTQGQGRRDGIIRDGWRSEEVKRSLDLCLACKGCKTECPVGVDVATYKAEFLSHYYEGRVRPRSAYAFGNIDFWARLASHAPGLVNLTTQLPFLREIAKLAAGIPFQRSIPAFAPQTFKSWFRRRQPNSNGPPVLLWPDTFNNYFLPATAKAAVEVLEAAGFSVILPQANLCCGRPLYDFGMLDRAKDLLLQILDELSPEIEAGIPVVGLEPSCVAVFRDELLNLFPDDKRAQALARQTFLLSEFLEGNAGHWAPPRFERKALLHGHCHHKSIMKMTAEESVLRRIGVDFHSPAPGCCGMAGSFGFEHDKYDISTAIGELELLPAVRKAPDDWLIIADGFSCREQIAQGSDRHALHLAEVLQMALARPSAGDSGPYPESSRALQRQIDVRTSMTRSVLSLGALMAGGLLLRRRVIRR